MFTRFNLKYDKENIVNFSGKFKNWPLKIEHEMKIQGRKKTFKVNFIFSVATLERISIFDPELCFRSRILVAW